MDQIIKQLAKKHGWKYLEYQANISMISFIKISSQSDQMRINIYLTTMTVATALNHPKQGRTQLYRKRCTLEDIEKIFKNPRQHTNKGYHTK